jgi:hypothetical protein
MNREEAKKILGENATEEQITNLLNNYHIQESAKLKELQNQVNSLNEQNSKYSDYDEIKSKLDEINKANMSEQEKLEQMKKETELNLKNSRIIVNTAKAKSILAGLDLDDDIISLVVSDDENKTISNANKLKSKFDIQKENVAKETKETLISADLTPTMTNVNQNENATMTFDKFADMSTEEQNKWLAENPNGLENLN